MKKITLIVLLCTISYCIQAQMNTFPTTGNVGIGTTSASFPLSVTSSLAGDALGITNLNTAAQASIALNSDGYAWTLGASGSVNSTLANSFFINQQGVGIRMTINPTGNVGIGTTTPAEKLEINGNTKLTGSGWYEAGTNNWFGSANTLINGTAAVTDLGLRTDGNIIFMKASGNEMARFDPNGNYGIGTTDTKGYKLAVNGSMIATSVIVKLYSAWPDYVFKPTYHLKSLSEVKTYIDLNHHLPEMPSEKEIADKGINLGEMNKLLTKKIEELTLYLIEKDRENKDLKSKVGAQAEFMQGLSRRMTALEAKKK